MAIGIIRRRGGCNLSLEADRLDEACAGYDALGFISCTGTNFIVRAAALKEVGGSPTYTLTEDFALGMALKMYGWHCRYVQEYLAIGEAPDQVRNCYQQRSRWCKVGPCPPQHPLVHGGNDPGDGTCNYIFSIGIGTQFT